MSDTPKLESKSICSFTSESVHCCGYDLPNEDTDQLAENPSATSRSFGRYAPVKLGEFQFDFISTFVSPPRGRNSSFSLPRISNVYMKSNVFLAVSRGTNACTPLAPAIGFFEPGSNAMSALFHFKLIC